MKYTRLEVQGKKWNHSTKVIMQFFILIPLIAILAGSTATRFLIIPYMNRSLPKTSLKAQAVQNINNVNKIVFLQAGVFSNKDNAEFLSQRIKEKGFSAYLVQDKDKYRIIIDFSNDEKNLVSKENDLKADGYNSFLNFVELQKLNRNTSEALKSISEYMNLIANSVEYEMNYADSVLANKSEQQYQFNDIITMIKNKFAGLNSSGIPEDKKTELTNFNNDFLSKYANFIENTKKNNAEDLKKDIADEIITFYNLFKSVSQLYSN